MVSGGVSPQLPIVQTRVSMRCYMTSPIPFFCPLVSHSGTGGVVFYVMCYSTIKPHCMHVSLVQYYHHDCTWLKAQGKSALCTGFNCDPSRLFNLFYSFSPQDPPFLSCFFCAVLANLYSALPVVPLIMPHLPSKPFFPSPQFHNSQDHPSIAQYSARRVIAQTMRLAVVGGWTCCAT